MTANLTIKQAADLLNVSTPYLISLLDSGAIRGELAAIAQELDLP